jgi:probable phosphoglycerate mutase
MQGHTDIPLNDEGRKQAQELQKYFSINPVSIFLSSDLIRAHETARIANSLLQKPLHTTSDLRESYLGDIEGKTLDEVFATYGEELWAQWSSVSPEHSEFRFPGAESAKETVNRAITTLKTFCKSHDFAAAGICTHGLVIRRLLHTLKPDLKNVIPIPNCGVYTITYDVNTDSFNFSYNE